MPDTAHFAVFFWEYFLHKSKVLLLLLGLYRDHYLAAIERCCTAMWIKLFKNFQVDGSFHHSFCELLMNCDKILRKLFRLWERVGPFRLLGRYSCVGRASSHLLDPNCLLINIVYELFSLCHAYFIFIYWFLYLNDKPAAQHLVRLPVESRPPRNRPLPVSPSFA
jgi:hypothetical protein